MDKNRQVEEILFNPNVGYYDVQADTGPSFATRRQEAFNALTQIAAQNPEFMHIAGDILWKVADFPEAQILADRWRKIIPPNVTGDAPDPATEQAMHAAADQIQQQLGVIAKQAKELADKDKELTIKAQDLDLRLKEATAREAREDYEARTRRLVALGNFGPGDTPPPVSNKEIKPVVTELLNEMRNPQELEEPEAPKQEKQEGDSIPGVPGSRKAPDGAHYVKRGDQYYRVEANEDAGFHPAHIGARLAPDGHHYLPDHRPGREGKYVRVLHG